MDPCGKSRGCAGPDLVIAKLRLEAVAIRLPAAAGEGHWIATPPRHLALTRGYQQRFEKLRNELARIGAVCVRAQVDDPIRLVLDRMTRLLLAHRDLFEGRRAIRA